MDYRCPKHDCIFETMTDQRKPGALASADGKFPAHPVNGHSDCPQCQKDKKAPRGEAPRGVGNQPQQQNSGLRKIA